MESTPSTPSPPRIWETAAGPPLARRLAGRQQPAAAAAAAEGHFRSASGHAISDMILMLFSRAGHSRIPKRGHKNSQLFFFTALDLGLSLLPSLLLASGLPQPHNITIRCTARDGTTRYGGHAVGLNSEWLQLHLALRSCGQPLL